MNCQFSFFEMLCHYHSVSKLYNFYGGELTVHTNPATLGDIIKYYRENSNYTVEKLANEVGITERYLYRIENEGKKPSFEVLRKLILVLSIPSDSIFYPSEKQENIIFNRIKCLLLKCDYDKLGYIEIIISNLIDL